MGEYLNLQNLQIFSLSLSLLAAGVEAADRILQQALAALAL